MNASTVVLWCWDLEEQVRRYADRWTSAYRVYDMSFSTDGLACMPAMRLDPSDLTLITRHELAVLRRRPALKSVLRLAADRWLEWWNEVYWDEEDEHKDPADEEAAAAARSSDVADADLMDDISVVTQPGQDSEELPVDCDTAASATDLVSELNNAGRRRTAAVAAAAARQRRHDARRAVQQMNDNMITPDVSLVDC